jgi:hypothetical protein
VFSVAPDSPLRVPRLACQAVRYFGRHGLTSNPWHPAVSTQNTYPDPPRRLTYKRSVL